MQKANDLQELLLLVTIFVSHTHIIKSTNCNLLAFTVKSYL